MKKQELFLLVALLITSLFMQAQQSNGNPFARLGYKASVATFGEDEEFHDQQEVVEIGSVLFNTRTNEVVGLVEERDSLTELSPEIISISIDPHCEKYYSVTPYAYCMNNPVRLVDPDGKDSYEYDVETKKLTWINDVGGKKTQTVDFMRGTDEFISFATVQGENVFVYALKDVYAVTNFDAHLDDKSYNKESGYQYSLEDFEMRRELIKDSNPIGTYILDRESKGGAMPITKRDAEDTYGATVMGIMLLGKAMEISLGIMDTGVGAMGAPKSFNFSKTGLSPAKTPIINNSWNNFLKANKGLYHGPNWMNQAKRDYYQSPFYNKK